MYLVTYKNVCQQHNGDLSIKNSKKMEYTSEHTILMQKHPLTLLKNNTPNNKYIISYYKKLNEEEDILAASLNLDILD